MNTFHPLEPESSADGQTFCAVHPSVATTLRCNKCGRYMCSRCAVRTPVGYRCRECVHQQQDVYFNANQVDYVIAFAVCAVISVPATYIAPRLGLFILIFAGLLGGGFIGEIVHRAVGKRRGRYLWLAAAAGIVVGGIVALLPVFSQTFSMLGAIQAQVQRSPGAAGLSNDALGVLLPILLEPLVFVGICAAMVIARLRYRN